jgi:hypothetical protein
MGTLPMRRIEGDSTTERYFYSSEDPAKENMRKFLALQF